MRNKTSQVRVGQVYDIILEDLTQLLPDSLRGLTDTQVEKLIWELAFDKLLQGDFMDYTSTELLDYLELCL